MVLSNIATHISHPVCYVMRTEGTQLLGATRREREKERKREIEAENILMERKREISRGKGGKTAFL